MGACSESEYTECCNFFLECLANLLFSGHVYFLLVNFPRIITIILHFFLNLIFLIFLGCRVGRSRRKIYLKANVNI